MSDSVCAIHGPIPGLRYCPECASSGTPWTEAQADSAAKEDRMSEVTRRWCQCCDELRGHTLVPEVKCRRKAQEQPCPGCAALREALAQLVYHADPRHASTGLPTSLKQAKAALAQSQPDGVKP